MVGVAVDVGVGVIVEVGMGWNGVRVEVLMTVGTEIEPCPPAETSLLWVEYSKEPPSPITSRIMLRKPISIIKDRKPIRNFRKYELLAIIHHQKQYSEFPQFKSSAQRKEQISNDYSITTSI
jgi:hypothetical protein